ncbi:scoloptoxin SSD14-like [Rhipicephalus sanguineus]|uniref:scoloptoxin SSD14-like n=1 Tax=Rhipicephalus sanguineus TaxID=34632 RepID=UPI0020C3F125|nr:scoloptoxin SSD14-like [Rhipicephalus sanguineus]
MRNDKDDEPESAEDADDSSRIIADAIRARRQFLYGTGSVAATMLGLASLVLFVFYFAAGGPREPDPSPSEIGQYSGWAVVTDVPGCKQIPSTVYTRNGTMADAAVATMLCMGVAHPHASGLGGGFVALHYHRITKRARVLIATESAPRSARRENFTDSKALRSGWKSVGVPAALYGYYALLSELGTTYQWEKLFEDAHYKASEGVDVDEGLADAIKFMGEQIKREDTMKPIYWNKYTKDLYRQGQLLRNPPLSRTLKQLSLSGFRAFYTVSKSKNITLADALVQDLVTGDARDLSSDSSHGTSSLVTGADLRSYQPVWKDALRTTLRGGPAGDLTLFTAPPPTAGAVISYIMNVMNVKRSREDPSRQQQYALTLANMHYLAETFKYALQKRTHLGDDEYVDIRKEVQDMLSLHYASDTFDNILPERARKPEDYMRGVVPQSDKGTSNLILYSPSGDTLVISCTLHNTFGSLRMSRKTGVLLNNALSDFSDLDVATRVVDISGSDSSEVSESDARRANSMAPFKRPLTSLSPILVLGPKNSLLALAGSGGLRIPTSLSQVAIRVLWEKKNIKKAIDYPRIHTDLLSGTIFYEPNMPQKLMQKLAQKNHTLQKESGELGRFDRYSFVTGLTFIDGLIETNYDYRGKVGGSDGEPHVNLTKYCHAGNNPCVSAPFP